MIGWRSGEESKEVVDRDVGDAQDAAQGTAVERVVHRHGDGVAPFADEPHVAAALAGLAVAEPPERGDALLARDDRKGCHQLDLLRGDELERWALALLPLSRRPRRGRSRTRLGVASLPRRGSRDRAG